MFAKKVAGGSLNTTANLQSRCCCKEEGILAGQIFHKRFFITITETKDRGNAGSHD